MSGGPLISVETLRDHLDDPEWIVVDCRFNLMRPQAGREAYRSGHIQGAFYADLDQDLAAVPSSVGGGRHPLPDADSLRRLFGAWGVGVGRTVVVYDDAGGAIAARLWWLLRWMGHEQSAVLDGGLMAWQAAGLPLTCDEAKLIAARYEGPSGHMPVVDARQVTTGLMQKRLILMDARGADRFSGQHEPLDKVAGHVPGAINAPFQENLDTDQSFRSPNELAAVYRELLGDRQASEVTCMCGSGVTACHTLLALEVAGLSGASLYPGSWSDWISSGERPVATGQR